MNMDEVNEQLASFEKGSEIAENLARLNWERAMAKPKPQWIPGEVRILYATGKWTPEKLATLFGVSEEWIYRILPQPSLRRAL